ncbi:MAG: clostripain-related cysteine peptidase, partial [Vicinamibacteria bacterium]
PYARFLVASEGDILNHGWPYRAVLEAIVDREPEAAGAEIVRQFVGSYSDYAILDVPSHCAVSDLERIHLLAEPLRRLSELLTARIQDADVWRPAVLAHWEAQSYKDEEYVDLADFCDRLRTHVGDPAVRDACSDVIAAVGRIVGATDYSGSAFQFSTGLSIYFPWCYDAVKAKRGTSGASSDLESYQKLAFSRETLWGHFLEAYLWATRRAPRSELSGRRTSEATPTVQKEDRMAFETASSMSVKGGPARTKVKNHPSEDRSGERPLPVRNMPPWHARGTAGVPLSRLKNHPRKRED